MLLRSVKSALPLETLYAHWRWLRPGSWQAYLMAAAIVAAATLLRLGLEPWLSGVQFITYFPAVIVTSFLCGVRAGALAVVLSALAAWHLVFEDGPAPETMPAISLFALVAAADVAIIGALRAAIDQARVLHATLRDSEAKFRGLLESAPDAMVVADRTGRIVLANAMTERAFGYSREQMLGQPVEMLIPERNRRRHLDHRNAYHEAPQPRSMGSGLALFGRRSDGTEFPVEVSLSPVETSEGTLVFGAVRDTTVRQQHEEELASAKRRAETATRAKSEFLSQMSHELRTPLNAVIGFAQMLLLDQDKTLSSRQHGYCDDILKSGHGLLQLVNEILDLERVESGTIGMSLERVVVAEALARVRDTMRPLALQAKVTLEVGAAQEVPDVRADEFRLRQVLLNLASNAIKYNRAGGSVAVSALRVPPDRIRIVVADTGIGIPSARQRELFEPFNRLGAERTDIEGTGIGLALSKKLTEAMGGTIGFSSIPGHGSTFWIELPAAVGEAAPVRPADSNKHPSEAAPARAGGRTLLYVEDNPANLRLMEQLVSTRPDLVMLSASTPTLGLDLAGAHHPDLIVLDISLPEMTGYELLSQIRDMPATRTVPVIALSAAAMPADIKKGLAAGFFRYLTKPIDVKAFFAAIDEALAAEPRSAGGAP